MYGSAKNQNALMNADVSSSRVDSLSHRRRASFCARVQKGSLCIRPARPPGMAVDVVGVGVFLSPSPDLTVMVQSLAFTRQLQLMGHMAVKRQVKPPMSVAPTAHACYTLAHDGQQKLSAFSLPSLF